MVPVRYDLLTEDAWPTEDDIRAATACGIADAIGQILRGHAVYRAGHIDENSDGHDVDPNLHKALATMDDLRRENRRLKATCQRYLEYLQRSEHATRWRLIEVERELERIKSLLSQACALLDTYEKRLGIFHGEQVAAVQPEAGE